MMKRLIWISAFALSNPISASEIRIGLSGTVQEESSINQAEPSIRPSVGLISEWSFESFSALGELRFNERQTSSGGLNVKNENLESLFWLRRYVFHFERGSLLLQGGLGFGRKEFNYRLIEVGNSRQSSAETILGIGIGLQFEISKSWAGEFVYQVFKKEVQALQQAGSLAILYNF